MNQIFAAMLAVSACASAAQAQTQTQTQSGSLPAGGGLLSIEQARALALANAPGVGAADAGVRAAEAGRRVAGLRPNPSINVEVENVIGSGGYNGFSSAETTLSMGLPLELGGKRGARIAVAETQTERARLGIAIARADTRMRVTQAYNDAVASERRLIILREQMVIAQEVLRAASVRVRAGRASPIEEQRADVARINGQNAMEQAERKALLARGNLARLIGQVPGALDGAWFDRIGSAGPQLPAGADGSLALAAAQVDVSTAEAQVRLARSQRVPDLTLSAGARRFEGSKDVAAVFGVSIPFPLFNGGRANLDAAQAQREQAESLRKVAALEAEQAIAGAQADLANAQADARTANGPALDAAVETARIARIGYREGKFGQLDLLEAERVLAQTRLAAIDATAAYHDAEARLERLTLRAPTETGIQP